MTEGKKDVLDFPLEEVSIPQAIALMMQTAYNIKNAELEVDEYKANNERLQLLIEKLEGFVEDKIDLAAVPVTEAVIEDAPDDNFEDAAPSDTFLDVVNGEVTRVIHKGVVFGKLCNERVWFDPEVERSSTCIKEWGHDINGSIDHEDMGGNRR